MLKRKEREREKKEKKMFGKIIARKIAEKVIRNEKLNEYFRRFIMSSYVHVENFIVLDRYESIKDAS